MPITVAKLSDIAIAVEDPNVLTIVQMSMMEPVALTTRII
jgi:hypothetical protein